PGLLDPALDLGQVEVVGPAAQVLAELALREGAELATEVADVGVVDVAGHDIADLVAIDLLAQLVGRAANLCKGVAARPEESDDLGFTENLPTGYPIEDRRQLPLTLPLRGSLPLRATAGRGTFRCLLPRPACGERAGVRGNRIRRRGAGAGHPI